MTGRVCAATQKSALTHTRTQINLSDTGRPGRMRRRGRKEERTGMIWRQKVEDVGRQNKKHYKEKMEGKKCFVKG